MMNEYSKQILEKYQVRKSKKQKRSFQQYLQANLPADQPFAIEKSGIFGSENIIVGNIEKAKIIFAAHYDTCARLPFPNLLYPVNVVKTFIYQIGIYLIMLIPILFLLYGLLELLHVKYSVNDGVWVATVLLLLLMMAGPANKHTANDNTSGVITLIELICSIKNEEVAFVFFDHEELGLIGSTAFRKKHKKKMKETLLVNFDCVGDGNTILMMPNAKANEDHNLMEALKSVMIDENGIHTAFITTKKAYYPSDQAGYAKAIGVAAFLTNKKGQYYMNKIHTDKDKICDENNITYLKEKVTQLVDVVLMKEKNM